MDAGGIPFRFVKFEAQNSYDRHLQRCGRLEPPAAATAEDVGLRSENEALLRQIQSNDAAMEEMRSKMRGLCFQHPDNQPLHEAAALVNNLGCDKMPIGNGFCVKIVLNPHLHSFSPQSSGMRTFRYTLCDTTNGRLLRDCERTWVPLVAVDDPNDSLMRSLDHYTGGKYSEKFTAPHFALTLLNPCKQEGHLQITGQPPANRLTGTAAELSKARVVRGASTGKPQDPQLVSLQLRIFPSHVDVCDPGATAAEREDHVILSKGVEKLTAVWHHTTVHSVPFAIINNHPKAQSSRT